MKKIIVLSFALLLLLIGAAYAEALNTENYTAAEVLPASETQEDPLLADYTFDKDVWNPENLKDIASLGLDFSTPDWMPEIELLEDSILVKNVPNTVMEVEYLVRKFTRIEDSTWMYNGEGMNSLQNLIRSQFEGLHFSKWANNNVRRDEYSLSLQKWVTIKYYSTDDIYEINYDVRKYAPYKMKQKEGKGDLNFDTAGKLIVFGAEMRDDRKALQEQMASLIEKDEIFIEGGVPNLSDFGLDFTPPAENITLEKTGDAWIFKNFPVRYDRVDLEVALNGHMQYLEFFYKGDGEYIYTGDYIEALNAKQTFIDEITFHLSIPGYWNKKVHFDIEKNAWESCEYYFFKGVEAEGDKGTVIKRNSLHFFHDYEKEETRLDVEVYDTELQFMRKYSSVYKKGLLQ